MKRLSTDCINSHYYSSPKAQVTHRTNRPNVPLYANHTSSSSSTGTRTTNSHLASYYSSSPSTHRNTFTRKSDSDHNKHDSSTTIYSSSHQSDSLYNAPTRQHSARILTTSFNQPLKATHSPSYNRRDLPIPPINKDNEPRQILLPIGGGIVGKLASSTTNLSYRKLFIICGLWRDKIFFIPGGNSVEHSPVHRPYRNPSDSGIHDEPVGIKSGLLNWIFPLFTMLFFYLFGNME